LDKLELMTERAQTRLPLAVSGFLTLVSLFVFAWALGTPTKLNFDEAHYVPAAKTLLTGEKAINREHPPLGKYIMAVGIASFGDVPRGWRAMSTLFGALLVLASFWLGHALWKGDLVLASSGALLTFFNFLTYVQARIGMLDSFMVPLLFSGLALYARDWVNDQLGRCSTVAAGLVFGLALGCKWAALYPIVLCLLLCVLQKGIKTTFVRLALPTAGAYLACFLPYAFLDENPVYPWQIIGEHIEMVRLQLRVGTQHPYLSSWPSWPLMLRPIWYAFDREGDLVRAVLLLGNPLILWGGLVALLYCADLGLRRRNPVALLITLLYASLYLCWAVFPRSTTFFYYYVPAATLLSFAIPEAIRSLFPAQVPRDRALFAVCALALVMFVYFLPVLSGLPIPAESFTRWTWFRSWI
jgi:dolichyl-phosphate-mannose--protein O-mannosyl transferase